MRQINSEKVHVPYEFQNAPVPGGGFVTGFIFHPREKNILYARTDIGGIYRYDFANKTWDSLIDHVKAMEKWKTYPLSIALDPASPSLLYAVAGDAKEHNYLCRSKDYGEHFEYYKVPAKIHGNAPGRGTGERLMVDPHNPAILYFASQTDGLLISEDYGESFRKLPVIPEGGREELNLAFLWLDCRSASEGRCQTILVSTSGQENSPREGIRGGSLYISRDAGKSFRLLDGQPTGLYSREYPGFVGQRADFSGNYLFITMTATAKPLSAWSGYACDAGGSGHGCILRYELTEAGEIRDVTFVTPDLTFMGGGREAVSEITGFGGIAAVTGAPGHLICSTQCSSGEEAVLYTTDYGINWFPILYDLSIGNMDFTGVPYMKPEYNNQQNLIHWLSDIKTDPFDSQRAVFNTGTGIFMTENLTDALGGKPVVWKASCSGLEETVHMRVYSPPKGMVQLIDLIGDLGGFAFTDLTRPAENSFADENNQRYITCMNADYPDEQPNLVAVTARGNWKAKTTGGIIWSEDQCRTWRRLSDPVGISPELDRLIEAIHRPNTNPGWVAVSADVRTVVWCVADRFSLPYTAVVYTENLGASWDRVKLFDCKGQEYSCEAGTLKVFSDRVDPEVFYAFGQNSDMFISTDRARSFCQIAVPAEFPRLDLGIIERYPRVEIRAQSGKCGVIWMAMAEGGLWRLEFHKEDKYAVFQQILQEGEAAFCQGMGKAASDSSYDTLYISGIIGGNYGFYRSLDEGSTWQRINREDQMYGEIISISGDPRRFGRVYIATGSRGVLWGEPEVS